MSTDMTGIQMMLHGLREQQYETMVMLRDIADQQDESIRLLRGIGKLLRERASKPAKVEWCLPQGAILTGIQYLTTLGLAVYLLQNGVDVDKLAPLLKAFGLP
jgi:hypothetical protein